MAGNGEANLSIPKRKGGRLKSSRNRLQPPVQDGTKKEKRARGYLLIRQGKSALSKKTIFPAFHGDGCTKGGNNYRTFPAAIEGTKELRSLEGECSRWILLILRRLLGPWGEELRKKSS